MMKISLKPHHLKIYQQLVGLLVKYGRSDLVHDFTVDEVLSEEELKKGSRSSLSRGSGG